MRRFTLGFVVALCIAVPAVALAAAGDQTVKGNLIVNGGATIAGATFTRSVQAGTSTEVSNFGTVATQHELGREYDVTAGGFGYAWTDEQGNVIARIIAGTADPSSLNLPTPTLAIRQTPTGGELWFQTSPGAWVKVAG